MNAQSAKNVPRGPTSAQLEGPLGPEVIQRPANGPKVIQRPPASGPQGPAQQTHVPLTGAILRTWGIGDIVMHCDLATPGITMGHLLTLATHDVVQHFNLPHG